MESIKQEGNKGMENGNAKKRLFVDMDGTLAEFRPTASLEELYEEGYFLGLQPLQGVVDAVAQVQRMGIAEVYILSSALADSRHAVREKNLWLDAHLPQIPRERRLFPPCGEPKAGSVPGGVGRGDFLLDDYTRNLAEWATQGQGIKLLNGINHTRGTWKGSRIRCDRPPSEIAKGISEILAGRTLQDMRPTRIVVPARGPRL